MKFETGGGTPEITMVETFDAPRQVVWTAFTTPEHVVRWYGGKGFTNPVCEMDVRPAGRTMATRHAEARRGRARARLCLRRGRPA